MSDATWGVAAAPVQVAGLDVALFMARCGIGCGFVHAQFYPDHGAGSFRLFVIEAIKASFLRVPRRIIVDQRGLWGNVTLSGITDIFPMLIDPEILHHCRTSLHHWVKAFEQALPFYLAAGREPRTSDDLNELFFKYLCLSHNRVWCPTTARFVRVFRSIAYLDGVGFYQTCGAVPGGDR